MIKVLLVEDDLDLAQATRCQLASPPGKFVVIHATNLAEARSVLRNEPVIDIMLLDLILGAEDGSVLLEEAIARDPRLPVSVLSGIDDQATIAELYRRGADDFIVKGSLASPLALQVRIAQTVNQRDAYRAVATAYGLDGGKGARSPHG